MDDEAFLVEFFGKGNLNNQLQQLQTLDVKKEKLKELTELRKRASDAFKIDLSITDITVSANAGVLLGLANVFFKNYAYIESINDDQINWKGKFGSSDHKHEVARTVIDNKPPPKMPDSSMEKIRTDLHRQIGPTHDIFRFKETIDLLNGKTTDYKLWDSTATKILGHELSPIGMKFGEFLSKGGLIKPDDPVKELTNHLLIDFFSKRSLPIPGSTYIADASPEFAKLMTGIYYKGLNTKNTAGNFMGFLMVQLIIHGYMFLFKAVPQSKFTIEEIDVEKVRNLFSAYMQLIHENEFHVMMVISHGASFLVDTLVTTISKSYAGLFQLNYMSLLAFSKHLLQYLLNSNKEYRNLIEQAKEKKTFELSHIDEIWYVNFKTNLIRVASDNHFAALFNEFEMAENRERVVRATTSLRNLNGCKKALIRELEDL